MAVAARNTYVTLGLVLVSEGVLLTIVSYLVIGSVPLTALGVSTVILGSVAFALSQERMQMPNELSEIMLKTGLENVTAVIEEIGLSSKAVYLPSSSLSDGRQAALIPLHSNPDFPKIGKPLPRRLIVKFGQEPTDIGLRVTTLGSYVLDLLVPKTVTGEGGLESVLSSVLVRTLGLAEGVLVVSVGDRITMEAVKLHFRWENLWVYQVLGSPLASIAASVTAEVLGRKVLIDSERSERDKLTVELKVEAEA